MPRLVRYIEAGEVAPALAATYPLESLREGAGKPPSSPSSIPAISWCVP
jgi:hypothetical protein